MTLLIIISLAFNILLVINICIDNQLIRILKHMDKLNKETISINTTNLDKEQNLIKQLENLIYKKDLELKNKKETIKFLSDQNIVLNNEVQNISIHYSQNSDAIKFDRIKKGNEKFLQILQTSK